MAVTNDQTQATHLAAIILIEVVVTVYRVAVEPECLVAEAEDSEFAQLEINQP